MDVDVNDTVADENARRAIERFISRLKADLWPEQADDGQFRYQVDAMEMTITDSGGHPEFVRLRLVPGVNGLQVEWAKRTVT